MKKQRHQPFGHPNSELDRQHQGSIGGEQLAGRGDVYSVADKVTALRRNDESDITPGRDPAEGPDIAVTSPSHERWAQMTPQRDPSEGPIIQASTAAQDAGRAVKK